MSVTIESKFENLLNESMTYTETIKKPLLKHSKIYKYFRFTHLTLTTLTTVLLGLKLGIIGQNVAFVLSALATAITSWYSFNAYKMKEAQQMK